jgi:hypothetical protein
MTREQKKLYWVKKIDAKLMRKRSQEKPRLKKVAVT